MAEAWPSWGSAVSVHTGFIGKTHDGRTTTLGRNGQSLVDTYSKGI